MSNHIRETITVKVGRLGQSITEVIVERGATAQAALEAADEHLDEREALYFNSNKISASTPLDTNGLLMVASVSPVKGGARG
jgi:hypothetical protein